MSQQKEKKLREILDSKNELNDSDLDGDEADIEKFNKELQDKQLTDLENGDKTKMRNTHT